MADVNDSELLRSYVREGSEAAFAELVRRHIGLVHSAALRRVTVAAQAEEITQAVFVILARKAPSLRPGTVLEGWLYETTRLTSSSFLRGERRRQRREQEAYMQSTTQNSPGPSVWNQLEPLLEEGMAELGAKDRDAVVLRFFKDLSLREVAATLQLTESAAQSRVIRAVDRLRKFFHQRGVVLTAAALAAALAANSVQAAPPALAKSVTVIALAKGATASGSTLLVIKGALRAMAWTKARTVILAGALAVTGMGALIFAYETTGTGQTSVPEIQGAWEGVCPIGGPGVNKGDTDFTRIVLKITRTNSVYSTTVDLVDLGLKDLRFAKTAYRYPALHFDFAPYTSFDAAVNAAGDRLTFPGTPAVVLVRTNRPDAVPERFTASDYAARPGSDLQGCWESIFPEQLPVFWKIAEAGDGAFRGELDNPDYGENHKPFSVVYDPPNVTLAVLYGTGIFQGQINAARTEIKGAWRQEGKLTPLTLKRVEYQPEPPLPESRYVYRAKTDPQGHWQAALDSRLAARMLNLGQVRLFPVHLDIAQQPTGGYSAALELPLYEFVGTGDPVAATSVQYDAPNLRLEWKLMHGVFAGKFANGRLTGNLRLGAASFPLTFERGH